MNKRGFKTHNQLGNITNIMKNRNDMSIFETKHNVRTDSRNFSLNNIASSFIKSPSNNLSNSSNISKIPNKLNISNIVTDNRNDTKIRYISNHDIYDNINYDIKSNGIHVYISLTTIPTRFCSKEFDELIGRLSNQSVKPDKIFVSLCKSYNRKFTNNRDINNETKQIDYLKMKYPLLEIISPNDYGPATKLLGLIEYNNNLKEPFLKDTDLIIVVDDDMIYSKDLVMSHYLGYEMYLPDMIVVDERTMIKTWPNSQSSIYKFGQYETIYSDDYKGFIYGWLSFSITYRIAKNIKPFYDSITNKYSDLVKHDDLIFTLYAYHNKLYLIENRFITIDKNRTTTINDKTNPLREELLIYGSRFDLEQKVFKDFGIKLDSSCRGFIEKNVKYEINKNIPVRSFKLVGNVKMINPIEDLHIVPIYLDNDKMMITVTIFNNDLIGKEYVMKFILNDDNTRQYGISVKIIKNKFSCVISCNSLKMDDRTNQNNRTIMQTSSTNTISKNRYNSILTILNYSPQFPYIFFDDNDILTFVKMNYSKIVNDAINNLIPGAFVSDLFRYCYLYLYGGIYIDCKKILFQSMNDFIDDINEIYVRDIPYNFSYNAIIVCDKMTQIIRECIQVSVYNIIRCDMKDDTLKITGPGVLGDAIDKITKKTYQYKYFNKMIGDWRSCVYRNKILFFQNSYHGYYNENNYLKEKHYDTLWRMKKVFKSDLRKKYNNISSPNDISMFRNTYDPNALLV